jgi:hypothetical protein
MRTIAVPPSSAPTLSRRAFARVGSGLLALSVLTACYGKGKNAPEPVERTTVKGVYHVILHRSN